MSNFDIIEYLSGITPFVFDKAVLKRIAYERKATEVSSFDELDVKTQDLLRADLLFTAYYSPSIWASSTNSHGSYTKTVGQQTIYAAEKERLYKSFYRIYKKYDDPKLEEIQDLDATLQWLDVE